MGYRYDNIHYQPKYKHGITPKLPDDIVKGLFIPLPKGPEISWNRGHYRDPTEEQIKQNAIDNINYIANQTKNIKHILIVLFQPLIQRVFFVYN